MGNGNRNFKALFFISLAANLMFAIAVLIQFVIGNATYWKEDEFAQHPPGRWRAIPPGRHIGMLTAEQEKAISNLESIGYLSGYEAAPGRKSVTVYDRELAYRAPNLVVSGHAPEATLIDMEGRELHRWQYECERVWPDYEPPAASDRHESWRRAHLFENGDLLAIFEGIGLIKIDKDSNLIWDYPGKTHHDLFVTKDGLIYVLTRKAHIHPEYHKEKPVLEDFITVLDADGQEIKRVSILKSLRDSHYAAILKNMKRAGDILHTNTIELLDHRLAGRCRAFREGNVLISIRQLDTICVVDLEAESVVWALSGQWRRQHQPTVLDNGHMLIFDNQRTDGGSAVLEFDPFTREIIWEYPGDSEAPLFTMDCGSSERLPNGNTLISESNRGRAIEVTPDKQIVWEFINPHRAGENNELIATLFEVVRLDSRFPLDWVETNPN